MSIPASRRSGDLHGDRALAPIADPAVVPAAEPDDRWHAARVEQRLALLAEVSGLLELPLDPGLISRSIVLLAAPALAECALLVRPGRRGKLDWWRCSAAGQVTTGRIGWQIASSVGGLTESLTGTAHQDGQCFATTAPATGWPLPAGFGETTELLITALGRPGRPVGALVLVIGPRAVDRDLVNEFAGRVGGALANAVGHAEQVDTVLGLQSTLLPSALPTVSGVRFAAAYQPATGPATLRVGGDFYDVHPAPGGGAMFAIGDTCGHGASAAALAGHVRSALAALRLVEPRPRMLLSLLNKAVRPSSGSRFTSAVVGRLGVVATGGLVLSLGAAGHPAPLVLRSDGRVEEVAIPGGLLGIFPDARFGETELLLAPGETCVLYTDGITEARSGVDEREQYGTDRLRTLLGRCVGMTAQELVEHVHRDVTGWLGDRSHDDITLLIVQAG